MFSLQHEFYIFPPDCTLTHKHLHFDTVVTNIHPHLIDTWILSILHYTHTQTHSVNPRTLRYWDRVDCDTLVSLLYIECLIFETIKSQWLINLQTEFTKTNSRFTMYDLYVSTCDISFRERLIRLYCSSSLNNASRTRQTPTWVSVSTVANVSTDSILAHTTVSAGVWDALVAIHFTVPSLPGATTAETQVTVHRVLTPSTVQTGRRVALIDVLFTVSSSKPVI